MGKRVSKDTQTIVDVLSFARVMNIASMPAAVEAYRKSLRTQMRRLRANERRTRFSRPTMSAFYAKNARRLRALSARVRRLQRLYRSWQPELATPALPASSGLEQLAGM